MEISIGGRLTPMFLKTVAELLGAGHDLANLDFIFDADKKELRVTDFVKGQNRVIKVVLYT